MGLFLGKHGRQMFGLCSNCSWELDGFVGDKKQNGEHPLSQTVAEVVGGLLIEAEATKCGSGS